MKKFINVYSLPRSGTNLFASYLMMNYQLCSLNAGGGRFPIFSKSIVKSPIINCDGETFLRDELKFEYIGSKRYWPEQFFFKNLFSKIENSKNVTLLRNPFSIISSMLSHSDNFSSHKHIWNMQDEKLLNKFIQQYSRLYTTSIDKGYKFIIISEFFENKLYRKSVVDYLDLARRDVPLTCPKGHKVFLKENAYMCDCSPLVGYGGYKFLKLIEAERLKSNKYLINKDFSNKVRSRMEDVFPKELSDIIQSNGSFKVGLLPDHFLFD